MIHSTFAPSLRRSLPFVFALVSTSAPAVAQLATLSPVGIPIPTPPLITSCASGFVLTRAEAGNDLNGDGDGSDSIWTLLDPMTGAVRSLGLAGSIGSFVQSGQLPADTTLVPLKVSEAAQGNSDLNGDGDTSDQVLFVFDTTTGVATNTALVASWIVPPPPDRSVLPFMVSESELGVDVDQDGNLLDWVAHGFDPLTGSVYATSATFFPIPFEEHFVAIDGPRFLYLVPEVDGSVDLNGDGDIQDLVLHVYDVATATITNLGVQGYFQTSLGSSGNALVGVDEWSSAGIDRNGDGDALDGVAHVYDGSSNSLVNLGIAGGLLYPADPNHAIPLGVSEAAQGNTDLDGDQDAADRVLFFLDPVTLSISTTGIAAVYAQRIEVAGQPDRWLLVTYEKGYFGPGATVDLNGDGDTTDLISQTYTPSTGSLVNSGYPVSTFWVSGGRVGFTVAESEHGNTDFNGDGDHLDRCIGSIDPTSGIAHVLPETIFLGHSASSASHFTFVTDEFAQKLDQNGDGDVLDFVYRGYDLAAGTLFRTTVPGHTLFPPGPVKFVVRESKGAFLLGTSEGLLFADLNGDGDLQDDVPIRYRPTVGSCGTIASIGTSCADPSGHQPALIATGCLNPSGDLVAVIRNGGPGEVAFFLAGAQGAMAPLPGGCSLVLAPPATFFGPFPLSTQGLETGAVVLRTELPTAALSGTLRLQAFVTAAVPAGYLATNGLALTFSATP